MERLGRQFQWQNPSESRLRSGMDEESVITASRCCGLPSLPRRWAMPPGGAGGGARPATASVRHTGRGDLRVKGERTNDVVRAQRPRRGEQDGLVPLTLRAAGASSGRQGKDSPRRGPARSSARLGRERRTQPAAQPGVAPQNRFVHPVQQLAAIVGIGKHLSHRRQW
jgi:hypothetical protein